MHTHIVTEKFKEALKSSHTQVARADLYVDSTLAVSGLPILGGTVTEDSTALVRGRCNIQLGVTQEVLDLLPLSAPLGASLWPLGNELHVWAGIDFEDGTDPELIPQGVFRIAKPMLADSGEITLSVEGYDRGRSVSRAKFTSPYVIPKGTNYAMAIKTLIMSRIASFNENDFEFMTTDFTTPQLVFTTEDDPWEVAQRMASSLGAELFWDGEGVCILRPEPDPLYTLPMWEYTEGEDATFLGVSRGLDDEHAYNGVIVTGETSSNEAPIRAEAWDTNPNSPTYYDPTVPHLSRYLAVPDFINSQYITDQAQADAAAVANLVKKLGVIELVDLSAINNPAHYQWGSYQHHSA